MSYIITAEIYAEDEANMGADPDNVEATILSERDGILTFSVPGVFGEQRQRTAALCMTLIEAGYVLFRIGHSY